MTSTLARLPPLLLVLPPISSTSSSFPPNHKQHRPSSRWCTTDGSPHEAGARPCVMVKGDPPMAPPPLPVRGHITRVARHGMMHGGWRGWHHSMVGVRGLPVAHMRGRGREVGLARRQFGWRGNNSTTAPLQLLLGDGAVETYIKRGLVDLHMGI